MSRVAYLIDAVDTLARSRCQVRCLAEKVLIEVLDLLAILLQGSIQIQAAYGMAAQQSQEVLVRYMEM